MRGTFAACDRRIRPAEGVPLSRIITVHAFDNNVDHHSFANSDQIRVTHLGIELEVDFEARQLKGSVDLSLAYPAAGAGENASAATGPRELWLDSRDLHIENIRTLDGAPLAFSLGELSQVLGRRLTVLLPSALDKIRIYYHSSPKAQGLQWLTPAQTLGKRLPYLFSQSQPINARSWLPLQDTPKARVTFDARIRVPLGMRALMSAMNSPKMPSDGVFHFTMEKPIPTHLLGIAVGELAFGAIGERSGIYTEPAMLAAALQEFEDTEAMLKVAESLLGPYQWDRYDMLVLPPSFPFGGMENPRLAFLTPTLIAGDKSLVSTVAHELAHSWTGNLVSNATWRDLWLNEGFTTYFTNRIVEAVFGKEQAELERVIEYSRLEEELGSSSVEVQTLPANVQRGDPNLAFNRFTYDKASMFVHELELRLGRADFDLFLHAYVQHFAFEAITTETFVDYARQTLLKEHGDRLTEAELLEWVYGQGMPSWFSPPSSSSLDKVDATLDEWLEGKSAASLRVSGWRVHHWQYFLTQLPEVLSQQRLMELDEAFGFSRTGNAEIACDWFRVAIRNHFDPVLPGVADFLCRIGRGKFVRPLYCELQLAGYSRELQAIYRRARSGYHPSIQVQLDKMLGLQDS
jgi:leukotriene-A4 hydrolase